MKKRPLVFHTPSSSSFSITCLFYYSLCIILVLLSSPTRSIILANAQQDQSIGILDTLFNNNNTNFTQCSNVNTFVVHDLNRTYDHATNTFFFNLSGHSSIAVTNLNQGQNQYSSARTEVVIGFNAVMDQRQRLCPTLNNSDAIGCPIEANSDISIQQSFTLPETSLPLGNIITRYSTLTADSGDWVCVTMAPVGYQNPTWKIVFTYIPVAFTIFAALVSFLASFATVSEAEHDVFLFTSNYAMLPAALRLKSPGFFDLIYYAQFIVLTGQLNLNYPEFYQLFVSNFAWSYLLFPTQWLRNINDSIFPYNPGQEEEQGGGVMTATLLDQQQNSSSVMVQGHGLTNFANAVDMDVNNLFLASFIFMLIILAGCLFLCFLIWMVVQMMSWRAPHRYAAQTPKIINFTIGIILRVLTLFYLPMMVLGFFQLMLPAPWFLLLSAALVLVFHIFLVYGVIAFILLDVRPPSLVFSDITLLLRYGSLYNTFTDESFYFFLCDLVYRIFIGAMAGWFTVSGVAQMAVLLLFEAAYFTLHILRRPYASRHVNIQHILFGAFRLVILFLNIGYLDTLEALDRNKQALAYTQITLHCIVFLLMFAFPIRNLVVLLTGLADDEINETGAPPARMAFWRRKRHAEEAGEMRHHHHRVPTNDELDKFAEQQRFQQRQQQHEQEQEYQQLHNNPPPRDQQQRLLLQLQQEPMMEIISLRDEPPPPVAFTSTHNNNIKNENNNNTINTDDNRLSSRSSLPPPPPPPHRVKSSLELKPNIEQRNGWKIGGRNRHSVLGINPTQQQEAATATVIEPLMAATASDYHLQQQRQRQRPTSWGSTLSNQQQYEQQQYKNQRNNNNNNNNNRPFSFQ